MSRPIQPSTRRLLAERLAVTDPRCTHNIIDGAHDAMLTHPTRMRYACPFCGMSLAAYMAAVPTVWPNP